MSERWWMAYCAREGREDVERAVLGAEPGAKVVFTRDAAALRETLADGGSGRFAVAVGPSPEGVSDINLAAAVARDGGARRVMLVGRGISGSLRSRATRAGVDEVVDLDARPVVPSRQLLREVSLEPEPAPVAPSERIPASECEEGQSTEGAVGAGEEAMARQQAMAPQEVPGTEGGDAPVIVVSSGRGGVGKTTLVALAGLVAASWGMRVALVDLDLASGNLFTCFGAARPPALDAGMGRSAQGAVRGADTQAPPTVDELVACGITVAPGVGLWGPCGRPELAEKVSPQVGALLARLSRTHGLVLVDTSNTCTDAVAQAFQRCDRLLLVHDEDLAAVGSLSRMAALAVRLGVARTQIVRIANWGDRRVRFDLSVGRGELGLETARAFRLLDGGGELAEALAAGEAAGLAGRGADPVPQVGQALARILDDLGRLPESEAAQAELAGEADHARRFQLFRRKAS